MEGGVNLLVMKLFGLYSMVQKVIEISLKW